MTDRKVSVVVPCYNLENWIRRCLESLLSQTYQNLEIIVVDDGSIDNSFQIISQMASSDSRIIPVHQENKGVSAARNHGMDLATGEYLMFVDGDDYVADTYVQHFVDSTDGYDLVIGGLQYVYPDGKTVSAGETAFSCSKEDYVRDHYLHSLENRTIFGPVIKLYARSLIEQHHIRFEENVHTHEDALFVMHVLEHVRFLRGIEYNEYYYVQHAPNASLVSQFDPDEQQINNRYFAMMVGVIGHEHLRDKDILCIYSKYLHISISTIRKLYRSTSYSLRNGLRYIYGLLHNETFRDARSTLWKISPKAALKFYRPIWMVHAINYLAVKLGK